jgi:hypothetical protein
VRADENIQLTGKFALREVQVEISRKRVSVRYNVVICEHKRTLAEFDASESRGSRADESTFTEMLECRVQ